MIVSSVIELHKSELAKTDMAKLLRTLTFTDADDVEVQAYDYFDGRGVLRIPRGVWNLLPADMECEDNRSLPRLRKLAYAKTLDAEGYAGQSDAVRAMFAHTQGQVIAPPGRGKTEIALAFAAAAKTRTLIVVHTNTLFKQWVDRIAVSVPGCTPGKIQGKTCQVEQITVAMAQTIRQYIRKGDKFWRQWGCLIVDEAHHAAAETWSWLCNTCPAYYRFGVTASEKRSDGRQPLVKFNIGPVIHKLAFESQVPMRVRPIRTKFKTKYNGQQYTRIIHELVRDDGRNAEIAKLAVREVKRGNTILVLSRQIEHLNQIGDHMALAFDFDAGWLQLVKTVTGQLPRKRQHALTEQLRNGEIRCILGTQLFEEGADIPRINRIILAFPGTEITVLQKVGRGMRQAEGKSDCVVFDLVDVNVRVLVKQYIKRRTWYRANGIKIVTRKGKEAANEVQDQKHSQGRRLIQSALKGALGKRA